MLLGVSGALRRYSSNSMLVREAGRLYDGPFAMADLHLPLYDTDLEDRGIPAEVQRLADQIASAEAVVISTPEYNKSLSGVLKNALDWVSRVDGKPWEDKPVAIMSAAVGRAGGARANFSLRLAMTPFRPRLLTHEFLLADSRKQFDEAERLISERYQTQLKTMMQALRAEVARG